MSFSAATSHLVDPSRLLLFRRPADLPIHGDAAKTLAGASWSFNTASRPATASFAAQTWTFDGTGGVTLVYGYFVVKTSSGLLLFAERFSSGPFTITNSGDAITLSPQITLA